MHSKKSACFVLLYLAICNICGAMLNKDIIGHILDATNAKEVTVILDESDLDQDYYFYSAKTFPTFVESIVPSGNNLSTTYFNTYLACYSNHLFT